MKRFPPVGFIMSSAYVGQELIAEFGLLPPSFLTLGMGRLYEIQIDSLREILAENSPIYLTLPESFQIPLYDLIWLKNKGVKLLAIPDHLLLGEAIIYAINVTNTYHSAVRILHGDTILWNLSSKLDVIAAYSEGDDYFWSVIDQTKGYIHSLKTREAGSRNTTDRLVVCGYFAFSKSMELVKVISQERGDFIKGLNRYIQAQPVKIEQVMQWYDFGHIQTYFHSRRIVTTNRAFNALKITKNAVFKYSRDIFKINAEAEWFLNVPPIIRPYTARLLDRGQGNDQSSYSTEYQYAPNLSELYVFSNISTVMWKKILASCIEFLELCAQISGPTKLRSYTEQLIGNKTIERLEQYAYESGFDITHEVTYAGKSFPSLIRIAESIRLLVKTDAARHSTMMHGDFCFSNIFYNSRNGRISVIDPRGYVFNNKAEIYGDLRYDIAKYSHSVNGFYDFIIAGHYSLFQKNPYDFTLSFELSSQHHWLQEAFNKISIADIVVNSHEIKAITISLFLSMLPLHADRPDRQKAFIANAIRLYKDL